MAETGLHDLARLAVADQQRGVVVAELVEVRLDRQPGGIWARDDNGRAQGSAAALGG